MLKPRISRELLKEKLGDENVFQFYFGPIDVNKSYISAFRDEKRPSTSFFYSENGSLMYRDFTAGESYDFVSFVMKMFGITYYKALQQIAVDFGLITGKRSSPKEAIIKPPSERQPKRKKSFKIHTIKLQKHHLDFWAQYGITREDLVKNNIQAVGTLKVEDYQLPTEKLRFLYLFKDGEETHFKIYTPASFDYKWISSVPLHIPFGLDALTCTGDTLIITKSVKDCIVLRKFFPEVIGLQNEGKAAIKPELIKALKKCYKRIIVMFDMDRTGIFAANYFRKRHGFEPYFIGNPRKDLWSNLKQAKKTKIKDPSDFVKMYGLETFKQYLKHINLLE